MDKSWSIYIDKLFPVKGVPEAQIRWCIRRSGQRTQHILSAQKSMPWLPIPLATSLCSIPEIIHYVDSPWWRIYPKSVISQGQGSPCPCCFFFFFLINIFYLFIWSCLRHVEVPEQGIFPCYNPSHSSDSTRSLTQCPTRELLGKCFLNEECLSCGIEVLYPPPIGGKLEGRELSFL